MENLGWLPIKQGCFFRGLTLTHPKMHLVQLRHRKGPYMGTKSLCRQQHPSGVLNLNSVCGERDPPFEFRGNLPFWPLPFEGDGGRRLGLTYITYVS